MNQTTIHDLRGLSPREAYDFTQCTDGVRHGDVLLLSDGVGVLDQAWPCAVVGDCHGFHDLMPTSTWDMVLRDIEPTKVAALQTGLTLAWALAADGLTTLRNTTHQPDDQE